MGVDRCWCACRSSKPSCRAKTTTGEFDSHIFPPKKQWARPIVFFVIFVMGSDTLPKKGRVSDPITFFEIIL
jgi:hypothetical protein